MQRRIDQLQSEVRMMRGGGDKALRMEELETKISQLERDKLDMAKEINKIQAAADAEAGDAQGAAGEASSCRAPTRWSTA